MSKSVLTAFRVVAAVEAFTWVGLLVGMFFKRVVVFDEIGVQIFGPLHGAAFVAYCVIALLAWVKLGWSLTTAFWALVAAVPPLGTVVFERWASRTGRIAPTRERVPATA
ncbi:DUF3817 domain-containing protein [Nocardiopsis ansamitocini]|uniref:DUF3817 domain-containing protein n=1 Tax=Nocardiopsis ansamitocini TaxID=1670832 RepID=A0A9W6P5C9_9ACTN|nr:DUF3817 domain-containing protein [Nocardiopsis ansamitocini]GLU47680.1 hypothetical protein Nans01_20310 [Nocardiopsis ansamitocini]